MKDPADARTRDLPLPQPAAYTELRFGEPVIGRRGLLLPHCEDSCSACEHHEPFATNLYVVWCSLHGGHVPGGATCDDYLWPSEPS